MYANANANANANTYVCSLTFTRTITELDELPLTENWVFTIYLL